MSNIYRCQVTLTTFVQVDVESDEPLTESQITQKAEAQALIQEGFYPEVECDEIETVEGEIKGDEKQ